METKVCARCKIEKSVDNFCKSSRMKDGYQSACKSCMNASYTKSRKKKQQHYQQVQNKRRRNNAEQIREWKSARGCKYCGETFGPCLELHHLDSTKKENTPSNLAGVSFVSFLKESEKCVILCSNCHRKVHYGSLNV